MDNVIRLDAKLNLATVNLKAEGSARVNVESGGGVIIRPKIIKQVVPPAAGSISAGQWAEMKEKVNEWVNAAQLVGRPLEHKAACSKVYKQAKSAGAKGVARWADFPACDFEEAMKFLRSEIGRVRRTNAFMEKDPEAARKNMLAEIHKKKAERSIADAQYREYLVASYGVDSAKHLDMGQLQVLRDYVRSGGRFMLPKPKEKSLQELREQALESLMRERLGVCFNGINEAHAELLVREPTLFGIGFDAFNSFWKKQKITGVKRGRKSSALESPI